jgi:ribonuclease E
MSSNKMLIDATHPEETRVVVLKGGRVEEFDYESAARKLLRGNIFLAKVTRVEPSLQAAFVDYGGNRHGFLAFNEIHPDYYQIPVADRQALIEEEAQAEAEEEAAVDAAAERRAQLGAGEPAEEVEEQPPEEIATDVTAFLPPEPEAPRPDSTEMATEPASGTVAEAAARDDRVSESSAVPEATGPSISTGESHPEDRRAEPLAAEAPPDGAPEVDLSDAPRPIGLVEDVGVEDVESPEAPNGGPEPEQLDNVGSEDALEELPSRPRRRLRSYKIQEVIKRRQVILVQVVKEERGSKGAALTTYLSLAGRYTVLMPNTARGGGISRKITNAQDRKRLKAIAAELEVPEGMGLIIRTAGASRTKQEIKRDFEYLLRLWESVRELTLRSTAPSLVYEEGDLIKRSIRDLYSKDIDEIIVAGAAAYKEAKDFMRMLMPSHVKNVVLYQDPEPLFSRYQIERQLNAMFSPYVHLKSGGYLVINQTEALVAIDVNSGKSTREFSIEETALNTNLEAADEIARQLKLRDLAGLIVIDFIDMEEKRNNRAVERRLKDALRLDRARIQVGRISHFGLLEMSRQRLRTGVLEGSTSQCPHCQGTGIIRSTESVALAVIRGIEDALMSGPPASIVAKTTATVALYILNNKRAFINEMEARYGVSIILQASDKLQGANFTIEKSARAEPQRLPERSAVSMDWGFEGEEAEEVEEGVREGEDESLSEDGGARRSRRRRRRRGRRGERPDETAAHRQPEFEEEGPPEHEEAGYLANGQGEASEGTAEFGAEAELDEEEGEPLPREGEAETGAERRGRRGRRRGRRGGRRDREAMPSYGAGALEAAGEETGEPEETIPYEPRREPEAPGVERADDIIAALPPDREPDRTAESLEESQPPLVAPSAGPQAEPPVVEPTEVAGGAQEEEARQPPRRPRTEPVASEPVIERVVVRPEAGEPTGEPTPSMPAPTVRKGWWQRRFGVGE